MQATVSLVRPFTITAMVSCIIHGSNNNTNETPVGSFYAIPPVRKHEGKETEVPLVASLDKQAKLPANSANKVCSHNFTRGKY